MLVTSEGESTEAVGITAEYSICGDSVYYSSAMDSAGANLTVLKYQSGHWGAPMQLTEGKRYLENLMVAELNGSDYVFGMHTKAEIYEDEIDDSKNLVQAKVMPWSNLILEEAQYDWEELEPGEEYDIQVTVQNTGDHTVDEIEVYVDGEYVHTEECELEPGETAEFIISLVCPDGYTEYTLEVEEPGESDYTPDDNSAVLCVGYGDLEVSAEYQQIGRGNSIVAYIENTGIEPLEGLLTLYDENDRIVKSEILDELNHGEGVVIESNLAAEGIPLEGTVYRIAVESEKEELTKYNNEVEVSVFRKSYTVTAESVENRILFTVDDMVVKAYDTVEFTATILEEGSIITVLDEEWNEVAYTAIGENRYSFVMPESNVIITGKGMKIRGSGYCGGDETAEYDSKSGTYKNLAWTLTDDGLLTISGEGDMWNWKMSEAPWHSLSNNIKQLSISNCVTSIGSNAFCDCYGITGTLAIPDSVISIGEYAFRGCYNFTGYLTIPDSVISIGNSAFECCEGFNGDLTIGNGVTTIGDFAFCECRGFTGNLTLPDSVTSIGEYAFRGCTGFTGDLTIPGSVAIIGNSTFEGCRGFNGSLTIGNGVTRIGDFAFAECCDFTGGLVIPDSVTIIRRYAFMNCTGFTEIQFDSSNVNIMSYSSTLPEQAVIRGYAGSTAEEYAVKYSRTFKLIGEADASGQCGDSLTWSLNDGVLTISGEGEMWDYTPEEHAPWYELSESMTGLVIEEGITSIGDYAFIDCHGFTEDLILPESVTEIGWSAFEACSGFTGDLIIPNGVESISDWSFCNCTGFSGSLIIPESVTYIGDYAFCNDASLTGELTIPENVTEIGDWAFGGCCGFTGDLILPEATASVGEGAFWLCWRLEAIQFDLSTTEIYDSVDTLPEQAVIRGYRYSTAMGYSIHYERTFELIGAGVTSGECGDSLTWALDEGVLTISGEGEMWDWQQGAAPWDASADEITQIVLPDGLTKIGDFAFWNLSGMTEVPSIPDSVTEIGDYAFYACDGIEGTLAFPESLTRIGQGAFFNCAGMEAVQFSSPTVEIFDSSDTLPEQAVIYGYNDSTAEAYAERYGRTFERIGGDLAELLYVYAFRGNYYKLYRGELSWNEAKEFCEEHEGHLATISSYAEQNIINLLVGDLHIPVWLGASAAEAEGIWEWITDEPFDYTNWNDGEPDNDCGKEHYLAAWPHTWFDASGERGQTLGFILECESVYEGNYWHTEAPEGSIRLDNEANRMGTDCWNEEGNVWEYAFDNDYTTFYDAKEGPEGEETMYIGFTSDVPCCLTRVDAAPREVWASRMDGLQLQASNDGENWTVLYTLWEDLGVEKTYTITSDMLSTEEAFTQYRLTNVGTYLNLSEAAFYGVVEVIPDIPDIDYILGDVNGDGDVTNKDRLILARYLADWDGYELSSIVFDAADINGDGELTNKDRLILARHLADWDGYGDLVSFRQ